MWLGEQITERGIGNGISLLIFAGIVAGLPAAVVHTLGMAQTGELPILRVLIIVRDRARGDRVRRVHGARPAPDHGELRAAPGRRGQGVHEPDLAPAAEDQHVGRDPADLRLLAADVPGHGREHGSTTRTRSTGCRC